MNKISRRAFALSAMSFTSAYLGFSKFSFFKSAFLMAAGHKSRIVLSVVCRFPHPLTLEEFHKHQMELVNVSSLSSSENEMLATGELLHPCHFNFTSEKATWTYAFRDRESYQRWDNQRKKKSPINLKYRDGSFNYVSALAAIPMEDLDAKNSQQFLSQFATSKYFAVTI